MNQNFFGLLAKYPQPGLVKTRLAHAVGKECAAGLYKTIVEKVIRQTRPQGNDYERVIFYAPPSDEELFRGWLAGERLLPQRGGDIGRIMANALGDLFNAGAKRAVISGVDIPGLERGIVGDAFSLLENCEVVIGPALDGGYYLIGMKSLHDEVFRRIPWSTARVFQETVETIGKLGLRYASVKPLSDVDRFEDLEKFPELDV